MDPIGDTTDGEARSLLADELRLRVAEAERRGRSGLLDEPI